MAAFFVIYSNKINSLHVKKMIFFEIKKVV